MSFRNCWENIVSKTFRILGYIAVSYVANCEDKVWTGILLVLRILA